MNYEQESRWREPEHDGGHGPRAPSPVASLSLSHHSMHSNR